MKRAFVTLALVAMAFWAIRCKPAAEVCLTRLDLETEDRATVECFDRGYAWDECPARTQIMADYVKEQKKCF